MFDVNLFWLIALICFSTIFAGVIIYCCVTERNTDLEEELLEERKPSMNVNGELEYEIDNDLYQRKNVKNYTCSSDSNWSAKQPSEVLDF